MDLSRPKNKSKRDKRSKGPKEDTVLKGLKEELRKELLGLSNTKVPKAVREATASTSNRAVKTLVKQSVGP